jgi:hypothetical protein
MSEWESATAGLFLCLYLAMPAAAQEIANATLGELIADSRTPEFDRALYSDLLDSIARHSSAPIEIGFVDQLVTLH